MDAFVMAKFTPRPECRKCGGDRFSWEYRETVANVSRETLAGAPFPHLHLTCERCGWEMDMSPRDAA